jgi:hypothetical protein
VSLSSRSYFSLDATQSTRHLWVAGRKDRRTPRPAVAASGPEGQGRLCRTLPGDRGRGLQVTRPPGRHLRVSRAYRPGLALCLTRTLFLSHVSAALFPGLTARVELSYFT